MLIRLVAGAFVATVFMGGCAQNERLLSHPQQAGASYVPDAKEITRTYSRQEIIDQIMIESGVDEVIEKDAARVSLGAYRAPPAMVNREGYEKLQASIIQIYNPDTVRTAFKGYLDEHYDTKRFSGFLALLKTPLSQEMTALNLAAQAPKARKEMWRTGDVMMREASPQRLDLIRQIDEAAGFTESRIEAVMVKEGVIRRSMNKVMPEKYRMTEAELETVLDQERMKSMLPVRQFIQLYLLYAYRSVEDEMLENFLEMHQSETARWGRALEKGAWIKVSESIGKNMAEVMKKAFVETNQ